MLWHLCIVHWDHRDCLNSHPCRTHTSSHHNLLYSHSQQTGSQLCFPQQSYKYRHSVNHENTVLVVYAYFPRGNTFDIYLVIEWANIKWITSNIITSIRHVYDIFVYTIYNDISFKHNWCGWHNMLSMYDSDICTLLPNTHCIIGFMNSQIWGILWLNIFCNVNGAMWILELTWRRELSARFCDLLRNGMNMNTVADPGFS